MEQKTINNSKIQTQTRQGKTIFLYIDTILVLYLAYKFLSFWIYPQADQIEMIYDFVILIIFEFFMVHSGVPMGIVGRSVKLLLILIIIYGLFAVIINLFISSNFIIILYCSLVFNRILSGIQFGNRKTNSLNEPTDAQASMIGNAALNTIIYFLLMCFVCVSMDIIPEFGLTSDFLQEANYSSVKKIGGIFTDMPQVAICFGTLYYLILGLIGVFSIVLSFESAERRQERLEAIINRISRHFDLDKGKQKQKRKITNKKRGR